MKMIIPFTKMEGAGNDYVYINTFDVAIDEDAIATIAIKVSDRHFGIGSDGLVLICPSQVADVKMRMFNLDGTESEMCGNAIRCVAKYINDHKMINGLSTSIETLGGIKYIDMFIGDDGKVNKARVDMGAPKFGSVEIPCSLDNPFGGVINAAGTPYSVYCVSTGNPHAIVFVDDVDNFDVDRVGKLLESHEVFPKKCNIEFVEKVSDKQIKMRVYERGCGETMACGTGACASAIVCIKLGITKERVNVVLLGGTLTIEYSEGANVFMTGPCTEVFSGEIDIKI